MGRATYREGLRIVEKLHKQRAKTDWTVVGLLLHGFDLIQNLRQTSTSAHSQHPKRSHSNSIPGRALDSGWSHSTAHASAVRHPLLIGTRYATGTNHMFNNLHHSKNDFAADCYIFEIIHALLVVCFRQRHREFRRRLGRRWDGACLSLLLRLLLIWLR